MKVLLRATTVTFASTLFALFGVLAGTRRTLRRAGVPNPDALAYELTNILPIGAAACIGTWNWNLPFRPVATIGMSPAASLILEPLPVVEHLIMMYMAYVIYALARDALIYNIWKADMLFHHALTVVLLCIASTPMCHRLTLYFLGPGSIPTFFLILINSFRAHPRTKELHPRAYAAIRLVFLVSFITFKCVLWVRAVLQHDFRELGRSTFVGVPVVLMLTALQWYWGVHLVRIACRVWRPTPHPRKPKPE